jgi:hypothetical protein
VEAPSEGPTGDSPVGLAGTETVSELLGTPGMTVDWTTSEVSVSQGVEEAAGAVQAGVVASPVGLAGTEADPELLGTPGMTVD